jgi:hypothetical protein
MRRLRVAAALAGITATLLASVACGAGNDGPRDVRLAGTPLPTATPVPPTPAVCDPEQTVPLPSSIPADVAIPPDYVVYEVDQDRYLYVRGRVHPPASETLEPYEVLEASIIDNMRGAWSFTAISLIGESTYSFRNDADRREGRFSARVVEGCPEHVDLIWEFYWITDETPPSGG